MEKFRFLFPGQTTKVRRCKQTFWSWASQRGSGTPGTHTGLPSHLQLQVHERNLAAGRCERLHVNTPDTQLRPGKCRRMNQEREAPGGTLRSRWTSLHSAQPRALLARVPAEGKTQRTQAPSLQPVPPSHPGEAEHELVGPRGGGAWARPSTSPRDQPSTSRGKGARRRALASRFLCLVGLPTV